MVAKRKVLATNQIRRNEITAITYVVQQTTEQSQMLLAANVTQRRPALAERAEPTQQMRITAQLRRLMQAREIGMQKSNKLANTVAIFVYAARPVGGGKVLNLSLQDLLQGLRSLHDIFSGIDKAARRC
jgi:hypothetical protein